MNDILFTFILTFAFIALLHFVLYIIFARRIAAEAKDAIIWRDRQLKRIEAYSTVEHKLQELRMLQANTISDDPDYLRARRKELVEALKNPPGGTIPARNARHRLEKELAEVEAKLRRMGEPLMSEEDLKEYIVEILV